MPLESPHVAEPIDTRRGYACNQLFARYRDQGDTEALGQAFKGIERRMMQVLLYKVQDLQLAEDLWQESCVEMMKYAHNFRDEMPFEGWAFRVVERWPRHYRQRKISNRRPPVSFGEDFDVETRDANLANVEAVDVISVIQEEVMTYASYAWQALVMQYRDGMKVKEIAAELGVKAARISDTLYKVKNRLRDLFPHL